MNNKNIKRLAIARNKSSGFTLIELVVVVMILGILSAVALPKFVDLTTEARQAAMQSIAGAISTASSVNYGAKKLGNSEAITFDYQNPCDTTQVSKFLDSPLDSSQYVVQNSMQKGLVSCATNNVTYCELKNTSDPATTPVLMTIYCAR
ncbi:pilin [Duganella sp. PWIR1]